MRFISKAEVVRLMREPQRALADLIIKDVMAGNPPKSIPEADERYREGVPFEGDPDFDTGKNWKGDIREAALWTLILHGFARGGAVRVRDKDALEWQTQDGDLLRSAAEIEIGFGGNRKRMIQSERMLASVEIHGEGGRAVYVYTDSILDRSGFSFCKIGCHHFSGRGLVAGRVASQYGTANPGLPVVRYIFKTSSEGALEGHLHRHFKSKQMTEGVGTEWFEMDYRDVLPVALEYMALPPNAYR